MPFLWDDNTWAWIEDAEGRERYDSNKFAVVRKLFVKPFPTDEPQPHVNIFPFIEFLVV